MSDSGFLYIASGDEFIHEAKISSKSLKQQMPDMSVSLVTDSNVEYEHFDNVITIPHDDMWRNDFGDHVYHIDKSPYDKTIKLDTDIYFDGSVQEVFELLDRFDIALAQAPLRHSTNRIQIPELEEVPSSFPEYQGGVIAYQDNESFSGFLQEWRNAYESTLETGEVSNQASLRAALYNSDCQIATLPDEYNCLFRMPGCVNGKVKIFHGRLIETSGKGAPERADIDQAVTTLNSRDDLRAFYRSGSKVKLVDSNILVEGIDSLKRNGLRHTAHRAIKRISERF